MISSHVAWITTARYTVAITWSSLAAAAATLRSSSLRAEIKKHRCCSLINICSCSFTNINVILLHFRRIIRHCRVVVQCIQYTILLVQLPGYSMLVYHYQRFVGLLQQYIWHCSARFVHLTSYTRPLYCALRTMISLTLLCCRDDPVAIVLWIQVTGTAQLQDIASRNIAILTTIKMLPPSCLGNML